MPKTRKVKKKDFLTLKYPWLLNTAKTKIHDIIMNMQFFRLNDAEHEK